MNIKRLFFWAAVFFLLLAYVVLIESERPEKKQSSVKTASEKIFSFSPEKILALEIMQKGKRAVLKKSTEKWQVVSPEPTQEIRQEAIKSVVSAITDAVNIGKIEEDPGDLVQFGLSPPSTVLTVFIEGEKEPLVLFLGNKTPTTISRYAMLKKESTVFETGTFLSASLNSFMDNF